jgi:hypothetical protein
MRQPTKMRTWLLSLFLLGVASVCSAASVSISTASVPNGTVNTSYSAVIKASGGCTPYKWAIPSGILPAGVTRKIAANTTSLGLSGTPTRASTFSFTVAVTGCGGAVSQKSYKITIQPSAVHVVDLSWKASTSGNLAGYNVYRSSDASTWKKVNAGLVASTLYDDPTVANGSTYYYAVTAVDIHNAESKKSAAVKVTVP